MTHHWEPDADTAQYGIRPQRGAWQKRIETELDPYAVHDDHTTQITAITTPPRPGDVGLALARLVDRVRKCERRKPMRERLDEYLAAMVKGRPNPLAGDRRFRTIQDDVAEAAETLRGAS